MPLINELSVILIGKIGPALIDQRQSLIEEFARLFDDRSAAFLVISARPCRRRIEHVSAVKGIIQAAPTRIGGVQQKARIEHRHNQLRASHCRNLCIDILRANGEVSRLWHEIADLFQKAAIGARIMWLPKARLVPSVNIGLQALALCQKLCIARRKLGQKCRKACPELGLVAAQRGKHLRLDKFGQSGVDLNGGSGLTAGHKIGHENPHGMWRRWGASRAVGTNPGRNCGRL